MNLENKIIAPKKNSNDHVSWGKRKNLGCNLANENHLLDSKKNETYPRCGVHENQNFAYLQFSSK